MSVVREENGTWTVRAYYRDFDGERKRKTKRGFKTKQAAKAWERDFEALHEGCADMTLHTFWTAYSEDMRPRLKVTTWATKESIMEKHILPTLGGYRLAELTPSVIMRWQTGLLEATDQRTGLHFSSTYLRTVENQLSAILNHAVKYYGLHANPMRLVGKVGTMRAPEPRVWTREQFNTFADAIMDKPISYEAFEVLYWCGLRVGELLALTPSDIDTAKLRMSITKNFQHVKGEDIILTPKTPKSTRTIAVPRFLAEELDDYVRLFCIGEGERMFPVSKDFLRHEMVRGCKAANMTPIRIHDLRHSHVSLLIELGFSAIAIGDRIGHESVEVTYRYGHLFPNVANSVAETLDRLAGE